MIYSLPARAADGYIPKKIEGLKAEQRVVLEPALPVRIEVGGLPPVPEGWRLSVCLEPLRPLKRGAVRTHGLRVDGPTTFRGHVHAAGDFDLVLLAYRMRHRVSIGRFRCTVVAGRAAEQEVTVQLSEDAVARLRSALDSRQ